MLVKIYRGPYTDQIESICPTKPYINFRNEILYLEYELKLTDGNKNFDLHPGLQVWTQL